MVTLQSVQHHAGVIHHFNFLTFGHSVTHDWVPQSARMSKN